MRVLSKDLEDLLTKLGTENFNYIGLYMEQILSEYTLNADLWKIYVNYTDEKCKKGSDKQEIYQRAIKNCPFELGFWLGYMREQEKNSVALEVIVQTANSAISQTGVEE